MKSSSVGRLYGTTRGFAPMSQEHRGIFFLIGLKRSETF